MNLYVSLKAETHHPNFFPFALHFFDRFDDYTFVSYKLKVTLLFAVINMLVELFIIVIKSFMERVSLVVVFDMVSMLGMMIMTVKYQYHHQNTYKFY